MMHNLEFENFYDYVQLLSKSLNGLNLCLLMFTHTYRLTLAKCWKAVIILHTSCSTYNLIPCRLSAYKCSYVEA